MPLGFAVASIVGTRVGAAPDGVPAAGVLLELEEPHPVASRAAPPADAATAPKNLRRLTGPRRK